MLVYFFNYFDALRLTEGKIEISSSSHDCLLNDVENHYHLVMTMINIQSIHRTILNNS